MHDSKAILLFFSKRTLVLSESSSTNFILQPPSRFIIVSMPIKRDGSVGSLSCKTRKGHFTVIPPKSNLRRTLRLVDIFPPPTPVSLTLSCVPKSSALAINFLQAPLLWKGLRIEHGLPVSMKTGTTCPCTLISKVGDLHGLNEWACLPCVTCQIPSSF